MPHSVSSSDRQRRARSGRRPDGRGDEDGFAAVDALVALIILSSTVILTLSAAGIARRDALAAAETRHADRVLQLALLTAPAVAGEARGRMAGFEWRVLAETQGGGSYRGPAVQLCQRSAEARALVSGRRYRLATQALCPAPGRL